MPLTIIARIVTQPGQEKLVRQELEKLVPTTRQEAGCIQYDLHIDNENPRSFLFVENWETHELWQAHMTAGHLKLFMAATDGAFAEFTAHEMAKIA